MVLQALPSELAFNIKLQNLDIGNNVIMKWSDLKVVIFCKFHLSLLTFLCLLYIPSLYFDNYLQIFHCQICWFEWLLVGAVFII